MTQTANLPPVSTMLIANFAISFASVVDTGGKFANGVNDNGGQFATGINDTRGKFATGVNDTGGKHWDQLSDC
jgi:hypothetical protein